MLFKPVILICRMGNFVYYYWRCTSIYRPLYYPFRSLASTCHSSPRLEAVAEHLPHGDTEGPDVAGTGELEEVDALRSTPGYWQLQVHVEVGLYKEQLFIASYYRRHSTCRRHGLIKLVLIL